MPRSPNFDLQAHSTYSDGELGPEEVVASAAQAGVSLLALSDHDTVAGVEQALAAGPRHGVRVVSATELSSVDPSGQDLHILGYRIDHRDPALAKRLIEFRADRGRRGERMAAALLELGFELDTRPLEERARDGKPIGRPHLAQAVVGHPANTQRLREQGLNDFSAFLEAYLIEGRAAFRGRETPTVAEAIETIHRAGGFAVWAHPFWDVDAPAEVLDTIDRFAALGLDGVECFYVTHDQAQTALLCRRCDELGLLITGSSDYHGPGHRLFSRFRAHELYGFAPRLGPLDA
jgi:predicted metal-dependent phosphoesterase TrpH